MNASFLVGNVESCKGSEKFYSRTARDNLEHGSLSGE